MTHAEAYEKACFCISQEGPREVHAAITAALLEAVEGERDAFVQIAAREPSAVERDMQEVMRINNELIDQTKSVTAARALVAKELPGWWVASGLCALTGHASLGPDYNGPDGERLHREFPEDIFDNGFHADLAPGDGPHRECEAILNCLAQAKAAIASRRSPE